MKRVGILCKFVFLCEYRESSLEGSLKSELVFFDSLIFFDYEYRAGSGNWRLN